MKNILIGLGVLVLVIVLFFVFQTFVKGKFFAEKAKITVSGQTFSADIAKTDKEREIGLSEKKSLADKDGMLFVFDVPGYYGFWMRNMNFPIDIIFINGDKIVTIFPEVPAPQTKDEQLPIYTPTTPIDKVLEVKAGTTQKYNIKQGDTVKIENLPK